MRVSDINDNVPEFQNTPYETTVAEVLMKINNRKKSESNLEIVAYLFGF